MDMVNQVIQGLHNQNLCNQPNLANSIKQTHIEDMRVKHANANQ